MDEDLKLKYLLEIYNRQHYFIDRHDSMAEKFINVLLVEVTCLSIIYTFILNNIIDDTLSIIQIVPVIFFVFLFIISLTHLLLIVQPLSKKAKKYNNENLLNNENKGWIKQSLFYYQGIINHIDTALSSNKVPCDEYLASIETDTLKEDLVQQIFILSQYSKYKKDKLEIAIWLIAVTTILGLLSIVLLVI